MSTFDPCRDRLRIEGGFNTCVYIAQAIRKMVSVVLPLPSFEGPNSNLAPVFLLRLARIKAITTTSTCTFSTGHFDRQVPHVAGHLLRMLGK